MATIVKTSLSSAESVVTETTLDGVDDTFVYDGSKGGLLILTNDTAGALTPVITGADATTISVSGVGEIDLSAGYTMAEIADGTVVTLKVNNISQYLKGTITITGGTGLVAQYLEY